MKNLDWDILINKKMFIGKMFEQTICFSTQYGAF